jgi:hypothetical protein
MSAYRSANATVSAFDARVVTPSDSAVLVNGPSRALYVGSSGNLTVRMGDGQNQILFSNVPAGIFPIQVDMVYATGTTAANIVALY